MVAMPVGKNFDLPLHAVACTCLGAEDRGCVVANAATRLLKTALQVNSGAESVSK